MLDPAIQTAILHAVDSQADDAVALLAGLVRHRSVLGQEQGAVDAMAAAFEGLGLPIRRVPVDTAALERVPGFSPPLMSYAGRDNVVAEHHPVNPDGPLAAAAGPCRRRAGGGRRPVGPPRPSSRISATAACTDAVRPT